MTRQQVPNVELARDAARANLLTNGGFEIWQRGNGPFSANAALCTDFWRTDIYGTDTLSVTKHTTAANLDVGSFACAACTFTLGTGAGSTRLMQQQALAGDGMQIAGRTVTLSMRVKTATPNAVRIGLNNYYSATSHHSYSGFHSGSGQYETLTVTVAFDPTATYCQSEVLFAATCTAYLDNAMLVVGSVPADYAPLHPADDLARCLRYYELLTNGSSQSYIMGHYQSAGGNIRSNWTFRVQKPVFPTVTRLGTWAVSNCGQPTINAADTNAVSIYAVVTALGDAATFPNTTSNTITAEANP